MGQSGPSTVLSLLLGSWHCFSHWRGSDFRWFPADQHMAGIKGACGALARGMVSVSVRHHLQLCSDLASLWDSAASVLGTKVALCGREVGGKGLWARGAYEHRSSQDSGVVNR